MYKLVGHRGFPAQYPENTLVSIHAALQTGVRAIEFDVQCSADGTAYVFHDENLLRITGHSELIYKTSDAKLKQLSAHYPDRFADKFFGEPICTLQAMMTLLLEYPNVEVFIEPKSHSIEHFGVAALMNTILRESECLGERRRIISFHQGALAYARQPHKEKPCENIVWVISDFSPDTAKIAQALQPNTLCADIKLLPPRLPSWTTAQWMIYPMDDASKLQHYGDMGIEYIETDDIGTMLAPQFT